MPLFAREHPHDVFNECTVEGSVGREQRMNSFLSKGSFFVLRSASLSGHHLEVVDCDQQVCLWAEQSGFPGSLRLFLAIVGGLAGALGGVAAFFMIVYVAELNRSVIPEEVIIGLMVVLMVVPMIGIPFLVLWKRRDVLVYADAARKSLLLALCDDRGHRFRINDGGGRALADIAEKSNGWLVTDPQGAVITVGRRMAEPAITVDVVKQLGLSTNRLDTGYYAFTRKGDGSRAGSVRKTSDLLGGALVELVDEPRGRDDRPIHLALAILIALLGRDVGP
jgi:hypothetical protein